MTRLTHNQVRIGISGFTYPPWRGVFYPPGLRQAGESEFASRVFPTIELNGSFYSLQRPETYRSWYAATPDDFVFAVKAGRFITHMKRLRNAETALANFFASGLLCLGHKLGPILWQLPPSLYRIASCVADSAGLYPIIDAPSADFSYARLHGKKQLYVSGYSPRDLAPWARRVQGWVKHGDVFVYFDNDVKVRAPFDAQNLARILDGERPRRTPRAVNGVREEPRTQWQAWRRNGRA